MIEEDFENLLKVIVVGNGEVGKTSMITRFSTGQYTGSYKKTIGTDFMERELVLKGSGENIKLMLWDTAGQEMFSELTRNYYRGAGAVVYAFSTTDRASFDSIKTWRGKVRDQCGPNLCEVLIQNKIDLIDNAKMSVIEVEELAREIGTKLYRTCVKENLLVNEVFEYLAESYMRKIKGSSSNASAAPATASPPAIARDMLSPGKIENGETTENQASADQSSKPAFQLTPSKRRTQGKKPKAFCNIL